MHSNNQKQYLCCLMIIIFLFGFTGCGQKEDEKLALETLDLKKKDENKEEIKEEAPGTERPSMYIYVCGAVNEPGVYEVLAGSRIYESIEAAGGMNPQADTMYLNQAELLVDGQRIYVPTLEETSSQEVPLLNQGAPGAADGKVDLNTATKEELMTLTGIGEAKANSIIAFREQEGGFKSIEDIKKIEGIKDGVFNKIKDMIAVQ